MLEREDLRQVRAVVKDVLREGQLDKLPDLFGREHHKHRGTHDLTFKQLVDAPDYIDNRQFITIVNEDEDGVAFIDLLGTDHQVVVTKNPADFTLSLDAQLHIFSAVEKPYIRISNLSDTELDPVLQFGLGAADAVKFTEGVDDSDGDKFKIANVPGLGILAESQGAYGDVLVFINYSDDDLDFVNLGDFSTDGVFYYGTQGSGDGQFCPTPKSIAFDGVSIFVADDTNNRIMKFDSVTGAYLAKVSIYRVWGLCYWDGFLYATNSVTTAGKYNVYKINADTLAIVSTTAYDPGAANTELNGPRGICTDGTNLFITETGNSRVKKATMDGTYVSKVGAYGTGNGQFGASSPNDAEVEGAYLYVCDYSNQRIQVFNKSDLSYVSQHDTQVVDGTKGSPSSIAINDVNYYIGCNHAVPANGYIEKYDIATRTYQATYDGIVLAARPGPLWGVAIAKFATSLEKYGDLFVIHQDGSYLDIWPKVRLVDDLRLVEDGDLATGDYVGLKAPAAVTASYDLTFPAAVPAAVGHFAVSTAGVISWGQDLGSTAGPSFDHAHLTVAIGTAPLVVTSTTIVTNLNADLLDGSHAAAFAAAGHDHAGVYSPVGHTHALDDLSDVNAGAPNDNDVLSWDTASSKWIAAAPSGGAAAFLDLTDVTEADYAGHANQFVKINAAENGLEFVASSVAAHALSSASHTDVDAGAPSDDDILRFDTASGKWKNEALPAASNHDLLSATHGDTLADTVVRGDLMIGNSTPKWARLAKGTSGYILTMGANDPAWTAPAVSPLTTVKGSAQVTSADSAVWVSITGLNFTLVSGHRYWFKFIVAWQTQATTRGIHFSFPSSPAMTYAHFKVHVRYGAAGTGAFMENEALALTTDIGSAQTVAANTDCWADVEGYCTPSANGDIQLKFHTEFTTNTVTVQNGGVGMLIDLG